MQFINETPSANRARMYTLCDHFSSLYRIFWNSDVLPILYNANKLNKKNTTDLAIILFLGLNGNLRNSENKITNLPFNTNGSLKNPL